MQFIIGHTEKFVAFLAFSPKPHILLAAPDITEEITQNLESKHNKLKPVTLALFRKEHLKIMHGQIAYGSKLRIEEILNLT
ncbi:hypothetical protein STSP2_02291 [Anaerohalosphaera lusitana]|uniref:Uncharacterized protein n=1 Tax=Anaerohalosphaera lusitana TaxID=1936003 RepID=A0A1U9NMY8_9BACT|nr:hypothetical protein [Anaerohalosphaera lusitana]AQT69104.1 hypothetical protein STSP2_02291 [Anaerohalosphaera lusitana]